MADNKRTVLFLCTGNSARSQMAEAIVNTRMGDQWGAVSAGTKPAGYVHSKALRALAEIGINHRGRSKSTDEFRTRPFYCCPFSAPHQSITVSLSGNELRRNRWPNYQPLKQV